MSVYSNFGSYLCDEYTISTGPYKNHHLSADVATNYMNSVINSSIAKFKGSPTTETLLFATCIDPHSKTEPAKEFFRIKKNMIRIIHQRAVSEGEQMDKSATPIYRFQLLLIITAYALVGTAEVDK